MARAGAASASLRTDSISGLAQSIAKPAYRRLLTAEPALRRAVPIMIVALGAMVLVLALGIFLPMWGIFRLALHGG